MESMQKALAAAFLTGLALGATRLRYPWSGEGIVANLCTIFTSGLELTVLFLLLKGTGRAIGKAIALVRRPRHSSN